MNNTQREALDILQEECAELITIASKVKRFGVMSENPQQPGVSAQQRLTQEMGDVLAMIDLVCKHLDITPLEVSQARQRKMDKLKIYSNLFEDTP